MRKGLVRIENTPDVSCMAGNKNKFLFAECVAECFWTSSNFKNDPQIRLSSGSFNENGTERWKACLRNLDSLLLVRCVPPFYTIFIALVSIGRRQIYPMTNRTGLKTSVIDWSICPECTCKFLFFFFLELITARLKRIALLFLLDK